MPTSSSHCSEQKEVGSANNTTSSELASLSQHTAQDDGADTMLVMMEHGSRLMASRSLDTDDEQAACDRSTHSTTSQPTKKTREGWELPKRSSSNSEHVAGSGSEQRNDISLGNSAAHEVAATVMNESAGQSTPAEGSSPLKPLTTTSSAVEDPIPAAASAAQNPKRGIETSDDMSIDRLIPTKKPRRKRTPEVKPGQSTGRWTHKEHQAFLEGLRECGREWKKVALRIPTRTSAQIRSHAQKYFAKLQRDQATMVLSDGTAMSAVPAEGTTQQFTPSVRRNVERILAHPGTVEREVEDTLGALRERYRQLQQRLEQRQRQRGNTFHDANRNYGPSDPHRKRMLENISERSSHANDDHSSVSSAVSASMASTSTRDLANEELIALQVLGGSLPRGDSSTEGVPVGDPASNRSSDTSIATNTEDVHEDDTDRRNRLNE